MDDLQKDLDKQEVERVQLLKDLKELGLEVVDFYLDCNESVEAKSDECSSVGNEIGTFPKCKTKQKCLEEIVHPV